MRVASRTVEICELPDRPGGYEGDIGWRIDEGDKPAAFVKTAAGALRRVRNESRRTVGRTDAEVLTIHWHPCSPVGRDIVRALTS